MVQLKYLKDHTECVASNLFSNLVNDFTILFSKLHYPLFHTDVSSARQQDFPIDLKFVFLSLHLHFYFLFLERVYLWLT